MTYVFSIVQNIQDHVKASIATDWHKGHCYLRYLNKTKTQTVEI